MSGNSPSVLPTVIECDYSTSFVSFSDAVFNALLNVAPFGLRSEDLLASVEHDGDALGSGV